VISLVRSAPSSGWSTPPARRRRGRRRRRPLPGPARGARGDLDAAAAALERSLDEHERLPMPFERARTLLA
jgi:hypothetical protein